MRRKRRPLSGYAVRLMPFSFFAGLGAFAVVDSVYPIAMVCGLGALYTGRRLLDRELNARKELGRRVRDNVAELRRVARHDRISAPQMEKLIALQEGVLESWSLLPQEYKPLLDDDIFTIVEEVETTARLARRRAALRRHLEGIDRAGVSYRVTSLERELEALPYDSMLRTPFEAALAGRREELDSYEVMLNGISIINAQLEGAESLLANLRGELLALDTGLSPTSLESGLVHLKERVAYFRRGLDEVTRTVDPIAGTVGDPMTRELPIR